MTLDRHLHWTWSKPTSPKSGRCVWWANTSSVSECCTMTRTEITPNHKFLRIVLHSMGLTNCKPTPTPSVVGCVKHRSDDDVDLGVQECSIHRGIVGSLQCLSIEGYDVQFETHACAKEMKQPTTASWTQLKRLARYLAGTQTARVVLMKPGTDCDPHEAFLRVWPDSDWAGDAKDRKKSIEFAN